jgi:hypothetical protein
MSSHHLDVIFYDANHTEVDVCNLPPEIISAILFQNTQDFLLMAASLLDSGATTFNYEDIEYFEVCQSRYRYKITFYGSFDDTALRNELCTRLVDDMEHEVTYRLNDAYQYRYLVNLKTDE